MVGLDTWNPSVGELNDDEVDAVVENLGPSPSEVYADREEKNRQGVCNFCGHTTTREFCGSNCEKQAAFATMGKSIKFHK